MKKEEFLDLDRVLNQLVNNTDFSKSDDDFIRIMNHPDLYNLHWTKISNIKIICCAKLLSKSFTNRLNLDTVMTFISNVPELKNQWQKIGLSFDLKPTQKNKQLSEDLRKTLIKGTIAMIKASILKDYIKGKDNSMIVDNKSGNLIKRTPSERFFFNQISNRVQETCSFYGDYGRPIKK